MKYIIYLILFMLIGFASKAQLPIGVPTQKINGWIENWYTVPDSGNVISRRDTNFIPRFVGTSITWQRAGIDTAIWTWNGAKWNKLAFQSGVPVNTNIANSSLTANGNYTQNWANNNLTFNSIKGLFFNTTGSLSGRTKSGRIYSDPGDFDDIPFMILLKTSKNGLPSSDSLRNFIRETSGQIEIRATNFITNKQSGFVLSQNGIGITAFGSGLSSSTGVSVDTSGIYLAGAEPSTSDSAYAPGAFNPLNGTNKLLKIKLPSAGSGTVTSVALSTSSAFAVTGSPITTSGTFSLSGAGTSAQYIRGNGTLATFDTTAIPSFYTKVRSLFSATSPIVYSNGAISILDATTVQKGAASFNASNFSVASGAVSLADIVSAGSCTNCDVSFNAKGQAVSFSNGSGGGGGIDSLNSYRYAGNVNSVRDTFQNLHYSVYNVLDFGLLNDSTSDNTSAFRALVNLVPNGSSIYFPAGNYIFSDSILIKKSLRIFGDGYKAVAYIGSVFNMSYPSKGGTNIYFTSATKNFLVYDTTATDKAPIVQIEKLSIINNASSIPSAGAAVVVKNNVGDGFLRDITVERFFVNVNVLAATRFTIDHCNLIYPTGTASLFWQNVVLTDGGGLRMINSSVISGSDNSPSNSYGIYLKGGGAVDISHNWFNAKDIFNTPTEFKYVIYSDWADGPTSGLQIKDNLIENYQEKGIVLRNYSGSAWYNVYVTGNSISPFKISGLVYAAIDISNFVNITLENNSGGNYYTPSLESFIKLDSITNYIIYPGRDTGWTKYFTATNSTGRLQDAVLNPYLFNENAGTAMQINNTSSGANSNAGFVVRAGSTVAELYAASQNYGFGLAGATILQSFSGGDIALYTGSQALTVKNNGNVLIGGTTDVGFNFDLTGTAHISDQLFVGGSTDHGDRVDITGTLRVTDYMILPVTGTNRDVSIRAIDFGVDNIAAGAIYPRSGTNASSFLNIVPRGTGFASTNRAGISFYNTDVIADNLNYEFAGLRAAGTRYIMGAGKSGTGNNLPVMLSAGYLDGATNENQILLNIDGTVTMASLAGGSTRVVTATSLGVLGTTTLGNTLYTGDGPIGGNRTITGGANDITFNNIDFWQMNATLTAQAKPDGTFPYTTYINPTGSANYWQIGYTPTVGAFTKGTAIVIDSNNNVGIGEIVPSTTSPLNANGDGGVTLNGLQSVAGNFYKVSNLTTNATLSLQQYFITVDASGGNVTLTLPAASAAFGAGMGLQYVFKRIDNSGNSVTVQRAGSDTVDGGTSFTLSTQYEVKELQCGSTTAWYIK